ncbi:lipid-binding SYLF domain-containing protein [Caballeronia humi]|uniref:Lipoprotein n=2 Tax=Caballeronia TaxID=1827195 RepID=A0A158JC56_9BURK|nr:YSC84-related protein [Caballeronia humi]SAL66434.1 lipoprotein [Caballeronia humi]
MLQQTDADAGAALEGIYTKAPDSRELISSANGVLIFPDVRAGGAVLGVEYGRGVLCVPGAPNQYYNARTATIGARLGYETESVILVFLTKESLDRFRESKSWTVGVDRSVALFKVGKSGQFDTNTARHAIMGFVDTKEALMFDLSLVGTYFSKAPV